MKMLIVATIMLTALAFGLVCVNSDLRTERNSLMLQRDQCYKENRAHYFPDEVHVRWLNDERTAKEPDAMRFALFSPDGDVELGFRDDGVVVWQRLRTEK